MSKVIQCPHCSKYFQLKEVIVKDYQDNKNELLVKEQKK